MNISKVSTIKMSMYLYKREVLETKRFNNNGLENKFYLSIL